MNQRWNDSGVFRFFKFWPVITTLIIVGIAWGVSVTKGETAKEEIALTRATVAIHETRLSRVEEAIDQIKDGQKEARTDIKEILRRVR